MDSQLTHEILLRAAELVDFKMRIAAKSAVFHACKSVFDKNNVEAEASHCLNVVHSLYSRFVDNLFEYRGGGGYGVRWLSDEDRNTLVLMLCFSAWSALEDDQ